MRKGALVRASCSRGGSDFASCAARGWWSADEAAGRRARERTREQAFESSRLSRFAPAEATTGGGGSGGGGSGGARGDDGWG